MYLTFGFTEYYRYNYQQLLVIRLKLILLHKIYYVIDYCIYYSKFAM